MRDTSARRERIASQLRLNGSVQVRDLAGLFDVSQVTIRKDLKFLDQCGIAVRAYGGAILNTQEYLEIETALATKKKLNISKKSRIAAAAASLIDDGDSIILDSGTTTCQIASQLATKENITVITNDLGSINQLAHFDNVRLLAPGGVLRRANESFTGRLAENAIRDLHVDKLFLGVDGFHITKGITTHHEGEATLNRLMCMNSSQVITVCDSSKFGKVCLHKIIEPDDVSTLVTDPAIPEDYREHLTNLGISVIIVGAN